MHSIESTIQTVKTDLHSYNRTTLNESQLWSYTMCVQNVRALILSTLPSCGLARLNGRFNGGVDETRVRARELRSFRARSPTIQFLPKGFESRNASTHSQNFVKRKDIRNDNRTLARRETRVNVANCMHLNIKSYLMMLTIFCFSFGSARERWISSICVQCEPFFLLVVYYCCVVNV